VALAAAPGRWLRRVVALLCAGLGTAGLGVAQEPAPGEAARLMGELMSGKAAVGGPFSLTDPEGRRRSLAEFHGKLVLLYFGYTSCPDTCPTDLAQIAGLIDSMGEAGAAVQPIFITLDPERDTGRVLRDYAAAFHPRLLALRGSEQETHDVARAYKISYRRVAQPGVKGYVLDHSAFTFVLDRDGRYLAFFPPGTPSGRMAAMLRELLP
jgi:protein SCO1/2